MNTNGYWIIPRNGNLIINVQTCIFQIATAINDDKNKRKKYYIYSKYTTIQIFTIMVKKHFKGDFYKPNNFSAILYNRFILFFVVFLSFINMVSYGLQNDYITPLIFILTSVLTFQYNQNMMIVFTVALVVSNVVKFGTGLSFKEGMTGKKKPMEEEIPDAEEEEEEDEETTDEISREKNNDFSAASSSNAPNFGEMMNKPSKQEKKTTSSKSSKKKLPKESFANPTSNTDDIASLRDTIKQTHEMIKQFKELKEDFKNIQ